VVGNAVGNDDSLVPGGAPIYLHSIENVVEIFGVELFLAPLAGPRSQAVAFGGRRESKDRPRARL